MLPGGVPTPRTNHHDRPDDSSEFLRYSLKTSTDKSPVAAPVTPYALLMGTRRAWRMQPVDDCSLNSAHKSLDPESPDDDRGAQIRVYRRVQTSARTTDTA